MQPSILFDKDTPVTAENCEAALELLKSEMQEDSQWNTQISALWDATKTSLNEKDNTLFATLFSVLIIQSMGSEPLNIEFATHLSMFMRAINNSIESLEAKAKNAQT